jgi:AcrR family transcriptional regulator
MLASQRPPRVRDADATRARVLEAAAALFARKGFDGVRLREIAEQAGATVPLVCHHFKDKETLYGAVIDAAIEGFAKLGWEVLARERSIEARLVGLIEGLIDRLAADPVGTALVHREMADGGARALPFAERMFRPLKEAAAREIRIAQKRGEVRPELDPDLLVMHLVSAALYPGIAAPIIRVVWSQDPLAPEHVERRKRELVALLRPLVLTGRKTADRRARA